MNEPLVWESMTPCYIRFISHRRYLAFRPYARKWYRPICQRCRDSDGTATAAANGDLPVPQDCQARAESIAQNPRKSVVYGRTA